MNQMFKKKKKKRRLKCLKFMCFRYKIYIEGWAWSVSEKYIFACDSPVFLMTLRWYDFFTRGMVPQHHYWPVRDSDKCRSLKFAVEWGNNHTEKVKKKKKFLHALLTQASFKEAMKDCLESVLVRQNPSVKLGVASSMKI